MGENVVRVNKDRRIWNYLSIIVIMLLFTGQVVIHSCYEKISINTADLIINNQFNGKGRASLQANENYTLV